MSLSRFGVKSRKSEFTKIKFKEKINSNEKQRMKEKNKMESSTEYQLFSFFFFFLYLLKTSHLVNHNVLSAFYSLFYLCFF